MSRLEDLFFSSSDDTLPQQVRRTEAFFAPENLEGLTLKCNETALVVIDTQRRYCSLYERGTEETEAIAGRIQSLAEEFRKANIRVYAVYTDLTRENPFYKFVPAEQDTLIAKHRDSAFDGTALRDILERNNKKSLLVCGFNKSACVLKSVLDGLKSGFSIYLLEDLAGDDCWNTDASTQHNANMELKYSRAILTTSQAALGALAP